MGIRDGGLVHYKFPDRLSWLGETSSGSWQLIRSMHFGFTVNSYAVTLLDPNYYLSPSNFSNTHSKYVNRVVD